MTDDFTLQNTKRIIEDKHGFKARYPRPATLHFISKNETDL